MEVLDEMKPNHKSENKNNQNIFVEFNLEDWEFIRKIPNFIECWEYKNGFNDIKHRREFGCVQMEDINIRFLGNKLFNMTPRSELAKKLRSLRKLDPKFIDEVFQEDE